MSYDTLGDRIKHYEELTRTNLIPKIPKIIRCDGRSFSKFSKSYKKPYDIMIMNAMISGATAVMKDIGGIARFAYIQSDEVSIVLNDAITDNCEPWFGNQIQKIVSISASIMSLNFCKYLNIYNAHFDSRVFQVPDIMEMTNTLIWRQQDATRNSISQYARSFFSHKELEKKSCKDMQEMMFSQKKFNWNDAPTWTKRGVVIYKIPDCTYGSSIVHATSWKEDTEIPIFTENRQYLIDLYGKEQI